jgi:hypothetical protein
MDIEMSHLPPDSVQEAVPIAEDDDVNAAGSNLSPFPTPVATEPNSLVLKLEFRSKAKEHPSVYARRAKTIIMTVMSKFKNEVKVFDNQEKEVKPMDFTITADEFNRTFTLHARKLPPKAQKKRHSHFYQFRITTTTAFLDIRKQPDVEQLLKLYAAILQTTPWQADIVDTAILGWQMGLIPSCMTSTEATEHIQRTLEMNSGKDAKQIPIFHCIPQTVTAMLQNHKITINVYCVSVQKVHFHKMSNIIAKVYMNLPKEDKFIFFKMKHEHPEAYAKAAFFHAKFVNAHRFEFEMDDPPPTPFLTTATTTTVSTLTTQPSNYADAVRRELEQKVEELKVIAANLMQRMTEMESAMTSTETTLQP